MIVVSTKSGCLYVGTSANSIHLKPIWVSLFELHELFVFMEEDICGKSEKRNWWRLEMKVLRKMKC